ncbi:hypothetical protein JSO61_009125 [Riemerella anatipestifer]|uniref:hypothetical protein n=1 Tax=Riemerella anatipestifer TaxID=34085 RepID=UPI0012ADAF88|nr:hypothetical protein [Riemerella anatipestifer]USL95199.1 hypothetical protein D1J36_007915 [Riemerella anatipestifer]
MEALQSINLKLDQIKIELENFVENLELTEICNFNMENCGDIPWDLIKFQGIYFIEIQIRNKELTFDEWLQNFKNDWEDERYKRKFVPNIKLKRIRKHKELDEWIPLYLGKSKNISSRIFQHIYKDINKTTFALKLRARENIWKENFRLSVIEVNSDSYDWVVPVIERKLRDKLNPILGKQ